MSEAAPVGGGRMSDATGSSGDGTQPQEVPPAFAKSAPAGQSGTHYFAWNEGTSGKPQLHYDAGVFWHGTSVHALPHIVAEGFRPSLGAGADRVMRHYGAAVPGVYVSPSWSTASTYPMMATTGPITIDEENHKGGLAGASLVARDGTYPMRALIRCVAQKSNRLWHRHKGVSKQSLFMPQDLHITHIVLYAVRPELVHES